ncbi:MAG: hypothetical protein IT369_22885 [Candidatus Latescibacteria bacterium]|nr:hypothetical protein [Candidatus Latescibacterota bacterium]
MAMDLCYTCSFLPQGWSAADWIAVGSPRWAWRGAWVQEEDHIRNQAPADASPEEWLGSRAPETYASQVWQEQVSGPLRVGAEVSFDHRMAPLIVLAPELAANCNSQPQYREHYEVVLYDEGINVWHHTFALGRPRWQQLARHPFAVAAGQRHLLEVETGPAALVVRAAGQQVQVPCPALPPRCFVGLTGCEGTNRFYSFSVYTSS